MGRENGRLGGKKTAETGYTKDERGVPEAAVL